MQKRPNKAVDRRADVAGIAPNKASIVRLGDAVRLERNDAWPLQRRFMQIEVPPPRRPLNHNESLAVEYSATRLCRRWISRR